MKSNSVLLSINIMVPGNLNIYSDGVKKEFQKLWAREFLLF